MTTSSAVSWVGFLPPFLPLARSFVGDMVNHLVERVIKYKALGNILVAGRCGHSRFLRFGVRWGTDGYVKIVSRLQDEYSMGQPVWQKMTIDKNMFIVISKCRSYISIYEKCTFLFFAKNFIL